MFWVTLLPLITWHYFLITKYVCEIDNIFLQYIDRDRLGFGFRARVMLRVGGLFYVKS